MKIIVPMSGVGKRFLNAGYTDPKPLIDVDGIPMIYHVIDLFLNESNFHFICNENHLKETKMEELLLKKVPTAKITTVPNEGRKGPVDAVTYIFNEIDDNEEVIVTYCDYGTVWNYKKFLEEMRTYDCDGGIASYIGFHPHMLGSDNYAFMKHHNMYVTDIQEKQPFTNNKMEEYASNGTYYFASGKILKHYFQKLIDLDMNLNGEYYVSLVYKIMIQDSLKVRIFEIEKMLQWGTPRDLEDYKQWSEYFKNKKEDPLKFRGIENINLILPMAGAGSRFKMVGYDLPKPLLNIENEPMVAKAVKCLPPCKENIFICLEEHLEKYPAIKSRLEEEFNAKIIKLDNITQGQACTCEYGLENIKNNEPILISACDNGAYYDVNKFYQMLDDKSIDVIVWSFTNNPTSRLYPHMYAWLDVDSDGNILDVSIKKKFIDRDTKHCIIGTMYFRTKEIYMEGLHEVYSKNLRTNNEYYVDNLLVPLIEKKYKVKVFEVKNYLCWGTPNDYKIYNYWEEYFNNL
jgi:NDP-sugar pyrophosphorylase family protein